MRNAQGERKKITTRRNTFNADEEMRGEEIASSRHSAGRDLIRSEKI